ncbi:hypothetical protein GFV14_00744 [Candidatus Hartigia pinicola]|nr:hypothetical protein GFV14_00744 [Candidatus Hartigia pinicola]
MFLKKFITNLKKIKVYHKQFKYKMFMYYLIVFEKKDSNVESSLLEKMLKYSSEKFFISSAWGIITIMFMFIYK